MTDTEPNGGNGRCAGLAAIVVEQIRARRKARGWSQPELSRRLNAVGLAWDRSVVANVEAGRRADIGVNELAALAEVFDVVDPWSLTSRDACPTCNGAPPAGFGCLSCGAKAETDPFSPDPKENR